MGDVREQKPSEEIINLVEKIEEILYAPYKE